MQTELAGEQLNENAEITNDQLKTVLQKYGSLSYEDDGITIKSIKTSKGYVINLDEVWNGKTDVGNPITNGSWNNTKFMYAPKLENTGLTGVYWNGTKWVNLNSDSTQEEWNNWYDYDNQKWANAQSKDGSMWVWIPRYEYKIDNDNKKININFIKIGVSTTDGYILHPAFSNNEDNGGWRNDLTGFWVPKYAAGFQNGTVGEVKKDVQYSDLKYTSVGRFSCNYLTTSLTTDSKISYPVFKSNTYAYNILSVGDAFKLSKKIASASMYGFTNVDSHLEKSSEWGAVAYLAHSKYGLNGNSSNMNEIVVNSKNLLDKIYVNSDSSTGLKANIYGITGYGNNGSVDDVNASCTKNMSGVFDLSGCIWELEAGYLRNATTTTPVWHQEMASASTNESNE